MKNQMTRSIMPLLAICLLASSPLLNAQLLSQKLTQAFRTFQMDEQLKYAGIGFCVQDEAGKTVFQYNENMGLAPASTQKIFTAAAALHELGSAFRYNTGINYAGKIADTVLNGDLLIHGSGDPTMGSWRYTSQPDTAFFELVWQALKSKNIRKITGDIVGTNAQFSAKAIPDGWIYGDIGNYYGAGSWALNYHENQYDISFDASGKHSFKLPVLSTTPEPGIHTFNSFVQLGASGSGDNSVIYAPPYSSMAYIAGTLGKQSKPFTISGSMPFGELSLLNALGNYLVEKGISIDGKPRPSVYFQINNKQIPATTGILGNYQSVAMDSVVYWFLQKSINLYGEALLKTLAVRAGKQGDSDAGADWLREFWNARGIDKNAIRIQDGSGLSPQNRVTASSQVAVLQYASKQNWFSAFYEGLPLIHNIKMKSGTIGGAKGYTGYISDKKGNRYSFSLLVNNYSGMANSVVQKMWALLDVIGNN
jgi:D-alanyl-D-alanine carboxypeptidase/D-alanyl-D-alanine-endopeptidase (penicillin-binding protein 4)